MVAPVWEGPGWRVETIENPGLGNRSYVVVTDSGAIAVDPPRDPERVEAVLGAHGAPLALVAETHRHADYLSGGLVLARRHDAIYAVPAGDPEPAYEYVPAVARPFAVGRAELRAVPTPGHTGHHVAYVLSVGGRDVAVFSGGSMLYAAVGRTDLVHPSRTRSLTHDQWRSVRGLAIALPGGVEVMPTHGFGSFCSAGTASDAQTSTIEQERDVNPALLTDENTFVEDLLRSYDTFPAYYERMPAANAAGPPPVDLIHTQRLEPGEVARALAAEDCWVIDVRSRDEFSRQHLAGSLSFPIGVPLSVYVPWLVPSGQRIVLLASTEADVEAARRELAQVGIDRVDGAWVGEIGELGRHGQLTAYPSATFAELAAAYAADSRLELVDVRRDGEWREGHVATARHVPLPQLAEDPGQVRDGAWVYCRTGQRTIIAASLLERAGRHVKPVDDEVTSATDVGLPWAEG
jgi:glyoxylase-like metal-dependent hydrolase (beta-lactamase superfamily II)/rhodanese-related sulfurtransferase